MNVQTFMVVWTAIGTDTRKWRCIKPPDQPFQLTPPAMIDFFNHVSLTKLGACVLLRLLTT
jgi:hypothetical protein